MKVLSKQDAEDLLIGAEILGCGGGGPIECGKDLIDEVYAENREFRVVDPKEVPNDSLTFIVSRVSGGVSEEILKKVAHLPRIKEQTTLEAAKELAKYLGEEPYAYLASEIGASNSIVPMHVAAKTGKFIVDGDGCGRAKPEIGLSTTYVKKIPITPLSMVTPFGDVLILKKTLDDYRAEDICRHIAIASGGLCGVARTPARGKEIRNAIVSGSITRSIKIGRAIREARASGDDPVERFVKEAGGLKLFVGRIREWSREKKAAFMWGNILIDGEGENKGHELKIWYKNEYLITWKDGKPYLTCPDTICLVDAETGRGLSCWIEDLNTYLGKKAVLIGIKASEIWRSKRGIEIFGPKHFGFSIEYAPVEKLIST